MSQMWITRECEEEAERMMKEWEKQGCTYNEIKAKLAALNKCFEKCVNKRMDEEFKAFF